MCSEGRFDAAREPTYHLGVQILKYPDEVRAKAEWLQRTLKEPRRESPSDARW